MHIFHSLQGDLQTFPFFILFDSEALKYFRLAFDGYNEEIYLTVSSQINEV